MKTSLVLDRFHDNCQKVTSVKIFHLRPELWIGNFYTYGNVTYLHFVECGWRNFLLERQFVLVHRWRHQTGVTATVVVLEERIDRLWPERTAGCEFPEYETAGVDVDPEESVLGKVDGTLQHFGCHVASSTDLMQQYFKVHFFNIQH